MRDSFTIQTVLIFYSFSLFVSGQANRHRHLQRCRRGSSEAGRRTVRPSFKGAVALALVVVAIVAAVAAKGAIVVREVVVAVTITGTEAEAAGVIEAAGVTTGLVAMNVTPTTLVTKAAMISMTTETGTVVFKAEGGKRIITNQNRWPTYDLIIFLSHCFWRNFQKE